MALTTKEIEHLAKLARLELTKAEIEEYAAQLGNVVDYVAKLQSFKGSVEDVKKAGVELRSDEVKTWPQTKDLIKGAPQEENNYISVPEVFDNRE